MQVLRVVTISAFALFSPVLSVGSGAAVAAADPADKIARSFIEAVTTDQIPDAYPLLRSSVRKELTQEQFSTTVVSFRITLGELRSLELEEAREVADSCRRRAYLGKFEHADVRFTFDLCRESEGWRVAFFQTEAVRMDREPLARKLVMDRLAQSEAPEVTSFECPGIDEAELRQVVPCFVGMAKGCIIEIGMEMTANGMEIAGASANAACDPILNPEG